MVRVNRFWIISGLDALSDQSLPRLTDGASGEHSLFALGDYPTNADPAHRRIPVVTCFLSLLVNIFYVIFERKVIPKHLRLTGSREAEISKSQKRPSFSALWLLPWYAFALCSDVPSFND